MAKIYKFGHKSGRKSWDSSELNKEWENRKAMLVFIGMAIIMVLIVIFFWYARKRH